MLTLWCDRVAELEGLAELPKYVSDLIYVWRSWRSWRSWIQNGPKRVGGIDNHLTQYLYGSPPSQKPTCARGGVAKGVLM